MTQPVEYSCYVPICAAIQVIGGKWSYFVIAQPCKRPLRFTFFMENYISAYSPIQNRTYAEAIAHDIPVNLIAVDDIGAFVKIAFQEPETFIGKTMEMASDSLTPPELAAAYSRATGQSIVYTPISIETIRAESETQANIYEWLNSGGHVVDLPALRALHPGLTRFEDWLAKQGKGKN
ncbi:NmrA family NAD(P)-binding protein [Brevibacillus choshinensis]|uniref:NmrA family NAD(P)-binding protein n=1 Tax=Brevibacillus choshinensis TaxID=54911 RepID=UPI0006EC3380|nr:NmrA family NAD(P)-binding protein [Brevibacillus choshinensis]